MFRTLRSRYRRIVPALIGSVAIVAAVLLAQSATGPKGSAAPQLAAAERSADNTASRGASRTADGSDGVASQIAQAAQLGEFGSPQDAPDATTTTTVAPTTTTTAAPTTTTVKPVTTTAKPPVATTKEAVVPVTQPAAAPAAQTVAQPKPASGGSICAISPGAWCSVAKCESGDHNDNTGNGYYGYFQFSAGTWHAMGGTGLPSDNSAATQLAMAQKLKDRSGSGQWPVCGKYLS